MPIALLTAETRFDGVHGINQRLPFSLRECAAIDESAHLIAEGAELIAGRPGLISI